MTEMTGASRRRMQDAFEYRHPDRIPVVYHGSPAGLYVHGQKLIDLFNQYPPDNPITFDKVPVLGPEAFEPNGDYHQILTDEWGAAWEYRIYGITGHPKYYPFESWKQGLESYRFPPLPKPGSPEFIQAQTQSAELRKNYFLFNGWVSIFEKLHALRPFDQLLMDLADEDPDLMAFLDRMVDYWLEAIDYYAALGTDVFVFGDDWGMQKCTLIDPALFRKIYRPRYEKLFNRVKQHGGLIFLHCCGYMGELLDEFLDMGLRGLWPQLNLYDRDETFLQKCIDHRVAMYIHPDRQRLIPLGTPREIDDYIRMMADRYHKIGGGAIFYVEIENDAPFENVKALIEAVDRYR